MSAFTVAELVATFRAVGARDFTTQIVGAQRSMDLAGESATRFAGGVDKSEAAMGRARSAASTGSAQLAKYQQAQLRLIAAVERYNALLEDENATVAQLARAEATLIGAQQRVAATVPNKALMATATSAKTATAEVEAFRGGLASTIETAGKLGLALGGFELARKALELAGSGAELTTSLNGVQAAAHASDAEMQKVRTEAIALGKDMTVPAATAVDAADAILDLVKAGIQLPRAIDAARPALLLAAATNTSMADTARVLGDTMDIFSIKGAGAAHVADILATSTNSASHDLLGLFDAIKYAGPSAQALGLNVDQVAAALTELAKNGISAQMGGTGLRMMLVGLTKDSPATQKALDDLGISAFDAQGRFIGFPKLFDQMHDAQVRMGPDSKRFLADLNTAFGARAQGVVALFAKEGSEGYDQFLNKLESGDVQKYANTMNKGLAAEGAALKKELTSWAIDGYDKVKPDLEALVGILIRELPDAEKTAAQALSPFVTAWKDADTVLGPVAHDIADVTRSLGPVAPVIEDVAGAAAAAWLSFKGYTVATAAMNAIRLGAVSTQATMTGVGSSIATLAARVGATMSGEATEAGLATKIMQAEFAQIEAEAMQSAAIMERWAAEAAEAQATVAEASTTSSAEQIAAYRAVAAAATAQAEETEAAAAATVTAADDAAAGVAAAGETAALGLGPMAALTAGGLLVASMFHHAGDSATDAAGQIKSLTQAIEDDTGALGKNARQNVKSALESAGAFTAARTLGISLKDVTDAALGVPGAMKRVNDGLRQYGGIVGGVAAANPQLLKGLDSQTEGMKGNEKAALKLAEVLGGQVSVVQQATQAAKDNAAADGKSTAAIGKNAKALADQKAAQQAQTDAAAALYGLTGTKGVSAYQAAEQAAQQNTAQAKAQTLQYQLENDAASLLDQTLQKLAGKTASVLEAQTSLRQANLQVTSAFKGSGTAIQGSTKDAVAHQQALQGNYQAAIQLAEAVGKETGSSKAEAHSLQNSKSALEDVLKSQGKLTPAVQAYIDKLYDIKNLKIPPTKIDVDDKKAKAALESIQDYIKDHNWTVDLGINASGDSVKYIPGEGVVTIHKKNGGLITGPGTGTSDSVLMWGSNGEFVSTASSTARNETALRAGNDGATLAVIKNFRNGGPILSDDMALATGGSGAPAVGGPITEGMTL